MDLTSYNIATININNITNPTKLDALRNFIRNMEADIIFLQELENEQLSLPGYNVICNVDHARRGTAIALKDYIQYSHVEKSLDGRLTALRIKDTTLVCIYAHSGSAMRAERERFFNHTLAYYLRHDTPHTILAGDFNCVLRRCDATGRNDSPSLRTAIQQLQLSVMWVKLCPRLSGHTYITTNSASAIISVLPILMCVHSPITKRLRCAYACLLLGERRDVDSGRSVHTSSRPRTSKIFATDGNTGPDSAEIMALGWHGGYPMRNHELLPFFGGNPN